MTPRVVGIKAASTFTGFCGHHDDSVFAPIEKQSFSTTQPDVFLFGYRHICLELYAKEGTSEMLPLLRQTDRGRDKIHQFDIQTMANAMTIGHKKGLEDVKTIKSDYDKALLANDFSDVKYLVIRIHETPDLMCSSGFFPTSDFDGNDLQDLLDFGGTPDHLAFSLIATDTGGAAIFSWLGYNPSSEQLVRSLEKQADDDLVQSIVRFVFEFFENTYISPDWWDGLDDNTKLAIRRRVSTAADATAKRLPSCLVDDGVKFVQWTIAAKETNLVP